MSLEASVSAAPNSLPLSDSISK